MPADQRASSLSPARIARIIGLSLYVTVAALYVRDAGIPTDRLVIGSAILVLLTILLAGQGWARWAQMVRDWLPFWAVLVAYDYSRGLANPYSLHQLLTNEYPIHNVHNSIGAPVRVAVPVEVDHWIGIHLGMGAMPTTWVQQTFHPGSHDPWFAPLVSLTYSSHFVVMPVVALVLWIVNRARFRVWMRMVVALAIAGVTTYFVYPLVPPWMASSGGAFPGPAVGRYTTDGFDLIGMHLVGVALDQGQYLANPVAAMPSLHMGYATLVVGFFWWNKTWWQRVLLASYPLAMAFSLVYGGEHYVTDELAGVAYAVAILLAWRLLRRRSIASTGDERPQSESSAFRQSMVRV
jgi:membrane-associated phospholipid phosphatase